MIENVGHSGWELGQKKDRAGHCAFVPLPDSMCKRDTRSLDVDFSGILDGPL